MNEEKAPEYSGFSSEPATPLEALERIIASLPPGNPARRELIDLRSSVAEQEEMISEARHTIEKLDEVIKKVTTLYCYQSTELRMNNETTNTELCQLPSILNKPSEVYVSCHGLSIFLN